MLNSILDRRVKKEHGYNLYLEMPEQEYFNVYESVNEKDARNILDLFLEYHQDDGRPQNINVSHNKNNSMVNINAFLSYEGNDHTDARVTPNYLRE